VRLVQTMTDNLDGSFRGVEDVEGRSARRVTFDVLRG
jgi:hypothetical protein